MTRGSQPVADERKAALIDQLRQTLEEDFLGADQVFRTYAGKDVLGEAGFRTLKSSFVQGWASRDLGQRLSAEQSAAVAATGGDIQVIARAGSGTMRTLAARAIFLQKHCGVNSGEVLFLVLDNEAASDLKRRLAEKLGEDAPPVMTFHAFAHAVVQPRKRLQRDDAPVDDFDLGPDPPVCFGEVIPFDDSSVDELGLGREGQEVIKSFAFRFGELMLAHYRDDWEPLVDFSGDLPRHRDPVPVLVSVGPPELLELRPLLPRRALRGEFVKSAGEKVIADALFMHGVDYHYQRNFREGDVNYRPDFTILRTSASGVVIEYFGHEGSADHDTMAEEKRQLWARRREFTLLEFSPGDLRERGHQGFAKLVLARLWQAGLDFQPRSDNEVWKLVEDRARQDFTRVMRTFVSLCRKRNLSLADLARLQGGHWAYLPSERAFLEVGAKVYAAYMKRLSEGGEDDLDGLLWRAASQVREGRTHFVAGQGREQGDLSRVRFVMVNGCQDLSPGACGLLDAIRLVNPAVRFFCVGDSWRALTSFAGTDPRFLEQFAKRFPEASKYHLVTDYRSPRLIVSVANALMKGQGRSARPHRRDEGSVALCDLETFRPSESERTRHEGDEITPAVLRLARRYLDRGLDVVLLARRDGLPWFVDYGRGKGKALGTLKSFLEHVQSSLLEEDRDRVRISTVWDFKALESPAVVVLDAVRQSYPLVHPDWELLRIFGADAAEIEREERRLFYVALTRATDSLAIVTETPSQSPYVDEIVRRVPLEPIAWDDMPPVPPLRSARLEVRISNVVDAADQLKHLGYRSNVEGRYWHRLVFADGFSFPVLLTQPWAVQGTRVEVHSDTGQLVHERTI